MSHTTPSIAIVGATGAVGLEALAILHERGVSASRIRAIASERSVGRTLVYGRETLTVQPLTDTVFQGVSVTIFATDAAISREFVPKARAAGAAVIDNSSAFRMDPSVPLIVPEVNGDLFCTINPRGALIANPNCSAAILLVAIEPIRRAFGIEHIALATYQAVSGAGLAAMDELRDQARAALANEPITSRVFHEQCAFNVFSHDSAVDEATGLNVEERKIIEEVRKITGDPDLAITPTCVRVPVLRAHTQAITVRLRRSATLEEIRSDTRNGVGIEIIDDRATNRFPTPLKAAGGDNVLVGRFRYDPALPPDSTGKSRSFSLFACGDQLRKGAALNAIQIAETLGSLDDALAYAA